MTSAYRRTKAPRGKATGDGDIPLWQLVIGGIFMAVGGMLAGSKIAEIAFSLWMSGS